MRVYPLHDSEILCTNQFTSAFISVELLVVAAPRCASVVGFGFPQSLMLQPHLAGGTCFFKNSP
ncbi:MAG TPA: hypothetical protein VG649_19440, partial [Candidatus Angelobacter sp.]|nr:hypothetical protein [Candidatus Angelobacter sp.]